MTDAEQRPGEGNRGAARDRGRSEVEHTPLDDIDLLAETHRLVDRIVTAVRKRRHSVPGVGTPAWWKAPDDSKVAALLVLAEHWLLRSPDDLAADKLKAMAVDLSDAQSWSEQARRPSHEELQRRRGEAA